MTPVADRISLAAELQRRAEDTDEVFSLALTLVVRCSLFNARNEPEEFYTQLEPDEISGWTRLVADACHKCPRDKRRLCDAVCKMGYGLWSTVHEEDKT